MLDWPPWDRVGVVEQDHGEMSINERSMSSFDPVSALLGGALIGLASALEGRFESRRFRAFALVLLLVSLIPIGHALTGNKDNGRPGPWTSSWIQILMNKAGWINY